jgi:hypothetical protein
MLCDGGHRETTTHSLTDKCPHGRDIAMATSQEVQRLISVHARKGKEHVVHLPLWFPAGNTASGLLSCHFAPFTELKLFD